MNGISPATSMCSEAIDTTSEPGDPLHDHTLLHELFYKHSVSGFVIVGLMSWGCSNLVIHYCL